MAHVAGISPISRLLIANRGEIARRIIRTAKEMGMATVAVYAEDDRAAPHVREADEALALGGHSSLETYLNISKIIQACRITGADAVHPGYGFLSENADFAEAVLDAGFIWVGPPPGVIAEMGNKLSAGRLMQKAGVPTLAARQLHEGEDPLAAAAELGYPVLVKAAAGGGGRGMRVVTREADLPAAVQGARREALNAFGNPDIFLEPWIEAARHVEIQILGDRHGQLLHCFERECSIQRRHQKVIEEAPSPALSADLRARMAEAALAAARSLGYSSAGTVEFLVRGEEFFFLEINTRLQVEHPVTEEITGLDLVREQLRIAEGEPLAFSQEQLRVKGHAIEARLYAEDPERGFLPTPGRVQVFEPSAAGSARFDSGVESGSLVSSEFDPMIAKVTVHAASRREAAVRLARALESTRIQGLTTNRDFLVNLLRSPEFLAADTTTDFIERVAPPRSRKPGRQALLDAAVAVALLARARRCKSARVQKSIPGGWRNSVMPPESFVCSAGDATVSLTYRVLRDGSFLFSTLEAEAQNLQVRLFAAGPEQVDFQLDSRRLGFRIQSQGLKWLVHGPDGDLTLNEREPFPPPDAEEAAGAETAPMPGRILALAVAEGDRVQKGQTLLVMEAMKMEHRITAPRDGVVEKIHVAADEQVAAGQLLVTLG